MAKKYYTVAVGWQVGIFDIWNDCKAATRGYSNSLFKSFENIQEARRFLEDFAVENAHTYCSNLEGQHIKFGSKSELLAFLNEQCNALAEREKQELVIVPVWQKYSLSIEEAAKYFRVGESKLRRMVRENPGAEWILWNGTRAQIKRAVFEKYLDTITAI